MGQKFVDMFSKFGQTTFLNNEVIIITEDDRQTQEFSANFVARLH